MHSRHTWWFAALLIAAGCKTEKVRALEADVAAAKARIATMDAKRKALLDEARMLEVQRQTLSKQADESELARLRLMGAGEVLEGRAIPDAVLLEEALRTKSPKLGALAATIVQRQLPCAEATPEETSDGPPDCQVPELPDECEGVAERTVAELSWSCSDVITLPGARSTAVCLAKGTWAASDIPWPTGASQFQSQVVRLATEHKGRLSVADWPPPSLELYRPPNAEELRVCGEANESAQCTRRCDEKHGRLLTACENEDAYGDGPGDFDGENEENPELSAARRAAAEAEAEAERARDELSYQECVAGCEPAPAGDDDAEPETPAELTLSLRKERQPAVFAFDVKVKSSDKADAPVNGVLVLGFLDAFTDVEPDPSAKDDVEPLETLLSVEKLFTQPLEGNAVLWFGPSVQSAGGVEGVRLPTSGNEAWSVLKPHQVCALAGTHPSIAQRCAALPPPPPDAGVVDAGAVDAGAPDAGVATDGGAP